MMKKFPVFVALTSLLVLTACSSEEVVVDTTTFGDNYEAANFILPVPMDWQILDSDDFTSNVPRETVVVLRNNLRNDLFTATLSVTETPVPEDLALVDFARSSLAEARNNLQSFAEISRQEEGDVFYVFQGKRNATDPLLEHRQLFLMKDNLVFTATASYLTTEDEGVIAAMTSAMEGMAVR